MKPTPTKEDLEAIEIRVAVFATRWARTKRYPDLSAAEFDLWSAAREWNRMRLARNRAYKRGELKR